MKLVYGVSDRPGKTAGFTFWKMFVSALQQLLAIMAATIAVPAIIGNGMTASAALFGAGVGTIVIFCSLNSKALCSSVLRSRSSARWLRRLPAAFRCRSVTSDL